jgi:hypothetical protein
MRKKKSEEKSIVTHKKKDHYDQLLTPLEVEEFQITQISPEERKEILDFIMKNIYGRSEETNTVA